MRSGGVPCRFVPTHPSHAPYKVVQRTSPLMLKQLFSFFVLTNVKCRSFRLCSIFYFLSTLTEPSVTPTLLTLTIGTDSPSSTRGRALEVPPFKVPLWHCGKYPCSKYHCSKFCRSNYRRFEVPSEKPRPALHNRPNKANIMNFLALLTNISLAGCQTIVCLRKGVVPAVRSGWSENTQSKHRVLGPCKSSVGPIKSY